MKKTVDSSNTGFFARVLQKDNDIIIAIRGTDFSNGLDLRNDIAMARSRIPAQTTEALKLYDKVAAEYPNAHIVLTGHSLGGSLAQIVGAIRGAEAVTFNAYGTRDMFQTLAA